MSIQVNCFDDRKAEVELKKCPKIVRDYVKLLKESNKRWEQLTNKAISKLREEAKNISSNSKIYHRGEELDYETAKGVIDEFPEEDDYVQANYQQFLRNGEPDDNTIEMCNYWNLCKKRVERGM